ncbi:Oxygen-insensitive NADPH nitroreductase [Clostridiaceae bacterium JG1575]|nr:Oxygen-insensitive NADPH nitroreductase [Clostridiaceae bacterium JG1575]
MNQTPYEIMTAHRSIRAYKDQPIAEHDLNEILEAAIHAPSSINGQQFSIIVVKDPKKKETLAALCGNQPWIAKAPVFLVFVSDYQRVAAALKEQNLPFENIQSIEATLVGAVDCGIAFSNAMTVAESKGYGIVPIGSVRRDPQAIIDLLDLPEYVYPIVGMCLGVPAEDPALKPRFPEEMMIHRETYRVASQEERAAYDETVRSYMDERTKGQDVRTWSETVGAVYSKVYFPEVLPTLKKQGYTNEK